MNTFRYQTVTKNLLGDLYTPVGVYMRLRDLYTESVLMESSDYHEQNNSRSFIGLCPMASIAVSHGEAIARYPDGTEHRRPVGSDFTVAQAINAFLNAFHVEG